MFKDAGLNDYPEKEVVEGREEGANGSQEQRCSLFTGFVSKALSLGCGACSLPKCGMNRAIVEL